MEYKLWIYTLKESNELYAYTDEKNLSLLFESQRNMDKFKNQKVLLTKEGLNEFYKEFTTEKLEIFMIKVFYKKDNKKINCPFVMTLSEIMDYRYYTINLNLTSQINKWFRINIFNKWAKDILNTLGYDKDISENKNLEIDELACFVRLFSDTL